MSQDTAYADALRQSPVCVFGLWLMPYSLRHEGMLLGERNAFMLQSPLEFESLPLWEKIHALDRATQICSNSHLKKFPFLRAWLLKKVRGNFSELELSQSATDFWNYLNHSRATPHLSRRRLESGEKPGRPFGAPLLAQLFQFVLTLPEIQKIKSAQHMMDAAWDYPFSIAIWRYFVSMEMEGSVQIENDDEESSRLKTEQIHREYNDAYAAWNNAATDDQRTEALKKHPQLRTMADFEEAVAKFEMQMKKEAK